MLFSQFHLNIYDRKYCNIPMRDENNIDIHQIHIPKRKKKYFKEQPQLLHEKHLNLMIDTKQKLLVVILFFFHDIFQTTFVLCYFKVVFHLQFERKTENENRLNEENENE